MPVILKGCDKFHGVRVHTKTRRLMLNARSAFFAICLEPENPKYLAS